MTVGEPGRRPARGAALTLSGRFSSRPRADGAQVLREKRSRRDSERRGQNQAKEDEAMQAGCHLGQL